MDAGTIAGIVIGSVAALILLIIILKMGVKVVQEKEVMIVERFGQFHRQLTAGINFLVPFVDRPRVRAPLRIRMFTLLDVFIPIYCGPFRSPSNDREVKYVSHLNPKRSA